MKFSIVTPSFNMERWIAETIESVISQEGDFEIEYTIVDDDSTDGTLSIAKEYQQKVKSGEYKIGCSGIEFKVIEKNFDKGMYTSINHGFNLSSGDIFAWINADDVYEKDAFNKISKVFTTFPNIKWLKGITSTIDENSYGLTKGEAKIYHKDWLEMGVYGQESYFVEQDSVFWRRELWEKVGAMPQYMKSAADYWLWLQFAKYTELWTLNTPISLFRKREGQISKNISKYKGEQRQARPKRPLAAWYPRAFFSPQSRLTRIFPSLKGFFVWLYPFVFPSYMPAEYIEIADGKPVIKKTKSYIIKLASPLR